MTFNLPHKTSAIALLLAAVATLSVAQPYPSKPITLVVPNPPGGFVDASARILSDSLAKITSQAVVVDNRGGGSGNVAYQAVVRAAPDMPETKTRADAAGIELRYMPPAGLDALVKKETEFWDKTIKSAGIKPE